MVPIGSMATFRDTTGPFRVPRYNLYPAAEVQLSLARGFSTGQAIAAIEKIAQERLLRMDRDRITGEARRQHRDDCVRPGSDIRVPAVGGVVRELAVAARSGTDRADVYPGRDARCKCPRVRLQHPGGDRAGGDGGVGGKERDPDRGVRAPGGGSGHEPVRSGGRRGADKAATDPDALPRVPPRGAPLAAAVG